MFNLTEEMKEKLLERYENLREVNELSYKTTSAKCGCYGECRNSCGESCYQR